MSLDVTIEKIAAICAVIDFMVRIIKVLWKLLRRPFFKLVDNLLVKSILCFESIRSYITKFH